MSENELLIIIFALSVTLLVVIACLIAVCWERDKEIRIEIDGKLRGRYANAGMMEVHMKYLFMDVDRKQAKLDAIKKHWQEGIGQIDNNEWRFKMARLVGDEELITEYFEEMLSGL